VSQATVEVANVPERRRRSRLRLACPVRLRRPGETSRVETKTEDISCEGFFCFTDRDFLLRETLECELVIPSEEFGQPDERGLVLRCRAEVVRVEPQAGKNAYGIACRLADYTLGSEIVMQDSASKGLSSKP